MTSDRSTLPASVRRWLDRAVPEGIPIPAGIQNCQEGEMEIRGKWVPFTAETFYGSQPFTFVWKARFKLLPGVWLMAEDGHDSTEGWGGAKLWGVMPMGGRTGEEVFSMQLVRSLAELPWYPQLALALQGLTWEETDDGGFRLRATFDGQVISVAFEMDGDDDVIQASGDRHYDVPGGFVRTRWRYQFSDHREFGGVRIPTSAAASYDKPDGLWQYWRGRVTSMAGV